MSNRKNQFGFSLLIDLTRLIVIFAEAYGDFYTKVSTNKVYRLNEDVDRSWYLSMCDEEGYHKTEKTSGRDMIRLVKGSYLKSYPIPGIVPIIRLF